VIPNRTHVNEPIGAELITARILFIESGIHFRHTNQSEFRFAFALHELTRNRITFKYPIKHRDGRLALPLETHMRRLENDAIQRKSDAVLAGKIQSTLDGCAFVLEGEIHRLPLSSKIHSTKPITFESVLCLARQYQEVTKRQRHYSNHRQFSHLSYPNPGFGQFRIALSPWIGDSV